MWIEVKKDIFESADFRSLNYVLQIISWYPNNSIPRYNVFVNIEKIEHTENYKKLSELDRKILQTEFDDAIQSGIKKGKYFISNKKNTKNWLKIEEAIRFLNEPIYIVLENDLNDGYLLRTIFHHFDKKSPNGKQKLVEFLNNGWLQFANGGGSGIENTIKSKEKALETIATLHGKETYDYLRCIAVIDSDRTHSLQDVSSKERIKEKLALKNIEVHILQKRAMENYMPNEMITKLYDLDNRFSKFKTWVLVYDKLSQIQKDYLNFLGFSRKDNKGESVKRRSELTREVQILFANLNDEDFKILDLGLNLPEFKNYFPTLFENNHLVNKKTLLNRLGETETENEFLDIIQKIEQLI